MWLSQDSKPSKLYCHTSGGKLFYRTKTHKMHLDRLLFRNSRYLNSQPAPSHIATNKLRPHGTWHIDDIVGILIIIIILKTPPNMAFRMTNTQPPSSKHPCDNLFDQGGTTNDRAAHRALAVGGWRERSRRPPFKDSFTPRLSQDLSVFFVFFGGWHNSVAKQSEWHEWLSFGEHAIVHVSYICTGVIYPLHPCPRIENCCSTCSELSDFVNLMAHRPRMPNLDEKPLGWSLKFTKWLLNGETFKKQQKKTIYIYIPDWQVASKIVANHLKTNSLGTFKPTCWGTGGTSAAECQGFSTVQVGDSYEG